MGINGLSTYLARNPENFETFHLHNTPVVIDAYNFLNYIYFHYGIYTQFGGEYIHFERITRKVLRGFQRCAVEPIFVFDGCHEIWKMPTQLRRWRFRMRTCDTLNRLAAIHSNPTDGTFCVPILPLLVPIALAQLLQHLRVRFVVANRESDKEAASLAIHLNCPLISDDSDFYITIPTSKDSAVCLIPLRWLSFEPRLQSNACNNAAFSSCAPKSPDSRFVTCAYLTCQKFSPSGPGLRELPPAQRPLFALLAGNDHFSLEFSALLPSLQPLRVPLARKATKQMRVNRRRLLYKHLINWLAGYGDNVTECMRRIVSHSPAAHRDALSRFLLPCVESYNVDPIMTASALSPFLVSVESTSDEKRSTDIYCDEKASQKDSLDDALRAKNIVFDSPSQSDTYSRLKMNCSSNNPRVEDVNKDPSSVSSITGSVSTDNLKPLIVPCVATTCRPLLTSHWPDELVRAFRKFTLFPNFLDALYCQGLVLNCAVESLDQSDSVYACSTPVRQVVYNLLLGIDAYMGESQPQFLVEYARKGRRQLKSFKIPVQSLTVKCIEGADWRYSVIQRFLTRSYIREATHAWLYSLALLTSVWHANVSGQGEDPASCALVLALVAIAICCWVLTVERSPKRDKRAKKLKQHLTHCAALFSDQSCNNQPSKKSSRFLQLHIVHAFSQFQSMYASLLTLGAVLDALVPSQCVSNNRCIALPTVSVVFPSGHLFHSIASCLSFCPPSERISWIQTAVFTRLLFEIEDDVNRAVVLFEHFMHWLRSMRENHVAASSLVTSTIHSSLHFLPGTSETHLPSNKTGTKSKKKSKQRKATRCVRTMAQITADVERIMLENDLTD